MCDVLNVRNWAFSGLFRSLILLCTMAGVAQSASALPSYARQTADSWGRPFANVRVGLQYTVYTKYDGASTNYDGTGRNASDNNTLYLFAWLAI
jgi:hypothetical protein